MIARADAVRWGTLARLTSPKSIATLGIVLAAAACWLAIPPLASRTVLWPILVGILAVAAGIWAVTRGAGRLGWIAVAAGVLGIALGTLATRAAEDDLSQAFVWSALLAATLRYATPLIFAAIGGMFSERSGVVNIGLEGMMLMGAFFGAWGADRTDSWVGGILIGMAGGGGLALVHAFFSIQLRADQIVSGMAVNFLALGISGYLYVDLFGDQGTPTDLPEIPNVNLDFLGSIPDLEIGSLAFGGTFLEATFGQLNLMIWLALALLPVSYLVMFKTPLGLRIRSVGEHPRAADTVGISVYGLRYAAVTVSGMLAALGGVYLSLGFVHSFTENMTAGRGFIALAALIFGNWRPFGAFTATLLFGFSAALALQFQTTYDNPAAILFEALPYVLTLIAVAGVIGRSTPPAAIGRPYVKQ